MEVILSTHVNDIAYAIQKRNLLHIEKMPIKTAINRDDFKNEITISNK